MKKALLLSAAALLLAVSCNRRPVRPAFGTVSVDTLLGNSGAGCRIEYRFATILNAAESPALQAVEQANIRYFFQTGEQTGSVREAIAAAVREIDTIYTADIRPTQSYEISVEAEGSVQDSLLTYVITRSSYTGGAHGIYMSTFLNLDLRTLAPIRLDDLFVNDYKEQLTDLLWNQLMADNKVATRQELEDMGYVTTGDLTPTENFYLSKDGITFYYNVYDIAPYVMGPVKITLPYEMMQHLLSDETMALNDLRNP